MNEPAILHEDEYIIAINKPAGLLVHPTPAMMRTIASGDEKKIRTLTDWVHERFPEIANIGESAFYDGMEIARPGIVHRLDKDTSGVLVIAKTADTFAFLKEQFQERRVEKTYRALVYGRVPKERGVIDAPIGRDKSDIRRWTTGKAVRGGTREAITEYKVLAQNKDYSYLELYPKTGRTHQIRVHLRSIHHPVVGDALYAPGRPLPDGLSRMALHAFALLLPLPNGAAVRVEAPEPPEFAAAVANAGLS